MLQLLLAVESIAACDPLLRDQPALFEATVRVRGGDRVKRAFRVPSRADVIALAREQDVDATLAVVDTAGRALGRADSPIRRSGIQRVSFRSPGGAGYFVELAGKEHAAVTGQVEVRIVTALPDTTCRDTHRLLAIADAAYAAGQDVTLGTATDPKANAANTYENAANGYKAVASRLETTEPTPLLAQTQHAVAAVLYQDLQIWPEAKMWADRAAWTSGIVDDAYGKARAEAILAMALMEIAVSPPSPSAGTDTPRFTSETLARAREILSTLATLHARRGEPFDQALALNNIGLAFYYEGLNDEAIEAYRRVLPLYEQTGERTRKAQVLSNFALAEYELGRLAESMPRYELALRLITPRQDPRLYATALQNSALANWASGNFDVALSQYGEALELWRTIQSLRGQARCLHGIGSVYDTIGDQELALDFYNQALSLRSAVLDSRGRTASLRAIANILRSEGRAGDALKMHQEALSLASNPSTRAGILVQIARDYDVLGQPREALAQIDAVLRQDAAANEFMGAQALLERSKHRMASGDLNGADRDLRNAMKTFRAYEAAADEFTAWVGLARVNHRRGALDESLLMLDKALVLAEQVRLQSANPELRATLLQPLRPAFDLKISILAERYFAAAVAAPAGGRERNALAALLTAEQSRARALADFENLDSTAPGVAPGVMEERQGIYRDLAAQRFQLEGLLDRRGTADARVATLRQSIAALRHRLDQIDARIGAASQQGDATTPGQAPRTTIDRRAIPADTAIIEYWLGAHEAIAWVATRERLEMVRLGSSAKVSATALAFHTALRSLASMPESERLRLGAELQVLIIQPIASHLQNKHRLIFAPDGALHYVPFAALNSGLAGRSRFLVESHDVAITPSIHMLLRAGGRSAGHLPTKQMLLVADPVYGLDDSRIARAATGAPAPEKRPDFWPRPLLRAAAGANSLSRLPGTAQEAATIAALLPKEAVDRLEGVTATRNRFLRAGLDQYRFIHVASHAITDSEVPQLSALILSTRDEQGRPLDGRVLAADFMNVQLHSDAVVLSACETALGKNVAGEGLVGLRYVILARGAKSVTSSLWQVPDEAAARLMSAMYSSLLRRQSKVDAALGEAMRAMISAGVTDPGMWGAFVATVRGSAGD